MRIMHLSLAYIHTGHLGRLLECLQQAPGDRVLRSDVHVQSQILAKAVDLALTDIALGDDEARRSETAPDADASEPVERVEGSGT